MADSVEKILVTGSAGFIGFHLSRKLLDLGYHVVGLDNLNPYYDVELKKSRLELLKPPWTVSVCERGHPGPGSP